MIRKICAVLILVTLAVSFAAYAYGAKSDRERIILSTIYFKNGSAELEAEFENDLKKVQAALETDSAIGLLIEGYGHNQGTSEKNREISQKRAQAVQQWFWEHGVEASRLKIKTYGDSKPIAQKNGSKGRSLSERVEILQVSLKLPSAYLPADRYEFPPVVEGRDVIHDFIVQNKGSGLLEIHKVKTD